MPAGHEDGFLNSNFHHQTHLRKFLVQNSILNKKLSNSFFVTIMYFFYHKKIQCSLWSLPKSKCQHPCKNQQISSVQTQKINEKAKRQKFNERIKCQMKNITKWVFEELKIKPISCMIFQRLFEPICQITFTNFQSRDRIWSLKSEVQC